MDETKTGEQQRLEVIIECADRDCVGRGDDGRLFTLRLRPDWGQVAAVGDLNKMAKIGASDHTRGSLKAPIKIINTPIWNVHFVKLLMAQ